MLIGHLLNRLDKVKKQGDGSYMARCPAHEDRVPSLHVAQAEDRLLLKCQAGCSTEAVIKILNLTMADLFTEAKELKASPKKIIAEYSYDDEKGNELFQVVRFEPKGFAQRHKNSNGEWVWNLTGIQRVLYHLPQVIKAEGTIYLVEGEKDANNLSFLGLTATTSPGGTESWNDEYALPLSGKQVVIVPDNDPPGRAYGRRVAKALRGQAASVRCIILPGAKDISDWLSHPGNDVGTLPSLEQDISALFAVPAPEYQKERDTILWHNGDYTYQAQNIIRERTGIHARLSISQEGQPVAWTVCNIDRSEERIRLANQAKRNDEGIRQALDLFCRGLWAEVLAQADGILELWSDKEVSPPEFLLEPILYKGLPTIIFGEKAVCKSTLAIVIFASLLLPWEDNPIGWTAPQRPVRTLLLDWEGDWDVAQWNAGRFQRGMGLPPFPLYYRRCNLPLVEDIEQIGHMMAELGAEAVIVDSLGPAVGGELNKPEQALRFTTALRTLKCASLIIGQTSKDPEAKKRSTYGSVFFEYYARNIFELKKVQEEGEDSLDIAMFQTHCNLGRRRPAQGFRLEFTSQTISIERAAITAPELLARLGTQAQILSLLRSGAWTFDDIMEELKVSRDAVRMAISRLKKGGKIVKVGDGWGLAERLITDNEQVNT